MQKQPDLCRSVQSLVDFKSLRINETANAKIGIFKQELADFLVR